MAGKCPKCERPVGQVICEGTTISVPMGHTWKGIACMCPICRTILSVAIDPIAIKADIVAGVAKALKER